MKLYNNHKSLINENKKISEVGKNLIITIFMRLNEDEASSVSQILLFYFFT